MGFKEVSFLVVCQLKQFYQFFDVYCNDSLDVHFFVSLVQMVGGYRDEDFVVGPSNKIEFVKFNVVIELFLKILDPQLNDQIIKDIRLCLFQSYFYLCSLLKEYCGGQGELVLSVKDGGIFVAYIDNYHLLYTFTRFKYSDLSSCQDTCSSH